ncbi:phosphotransferase [Microbacterium sp.]|uniref:phosphotransferase n=1 Tax=Microbacterium sp. TaxID=51671 RepID=UPI003F96D849
MPHPDDDALILASALDLAPDAVTFRSREPLGAGSVTGMQVGDDARLLYYMDTSGLAVPAETGMVASDDAGIVRIWQHPADPHLPALAPVAFQDAAHTLLSRLGFSGDTAPEMIAYRPGRRAVLRVATDAGDLWIKVVRPSRVERIVRAGTAAVAAGLPTPEVHGWSEEGLIVMAGAHGTPVTEAPWDPVGLLDLVDDLRARLTRVEWEHRAPGIAGRRDWYAGHGDERAGRILSEAQRLIDAPAGVRTPTVVHGDLHLGQLFLHEGYISGLIDIDTLAVGDPGEDAAAFLSHAIASALLTGGHASDRVWALADLAADRWASDDGVRGRTLIHLAGHLIAATQRGDSAGGSRLENAASALAQGLAPSDGRG